MTTNRDTHGDPPLPSVSDSGVQAAYAILLKLRKRTGLRSNRLRNTEIDVSELLRLPVVRRQAYLSETSAIRVLPAIVGQVACQLPVTQRLIVDSELCLGLLADAPPEHLDVERLYAADLGPRRQYLTEQWDRLHEALGADEIPPAPTERALRDGRIELEAFNALAAALIDGDVPSMREKDTVTVIGDAVMDHNIMVEEMPRDGMVLPGNLLEHSGGKGLNRAVALAQLGLDARLLTVLGNDHYGTEILGYLSKRRVDVSLVDVKVGRTPVTTVIRTLTGQQAAIPFKQSRVRLVESVFDLTYNRQAITDSKAVIITFETPMDVVERALRVVDSVPRTDRPVLLINTSPPSVLPVAARQFVKGVAHVVGAPKDLATMWPVGTSYRDTVTELLKRVSGAVCVIEGSVYTVHRPGRSTFVMHLPNVPPEQLPYSSAAFTAALAYRLLGKDVPAEIDDFRWAAAAVAATESMAKEASAEDVPNVPDCMPTRDRITAAVSRIEVRVPETT